MGAAAQLGAPLRGRLRRLPPGGHAARPDRRAGAFGYHLRLSAGRPAREYALGLRGCWAEALQLGEREQGDRGGETRLQERLEPQLRAGHAPGALALCLRAHLYRGPGETARCATAFCTCGDECAIPSSCRGGWLAGESAELCVWFGLGFEEVSAATSAKEMLRQGYGAELRKTLDWLAHARAHRGRRRPGRDAEPQHVLQLLLRRGADAWTARSSPWSPPAVRATMSARPIGTGTACSGASRPYFWRTRARPPRCCATCSPGR